MGLISIEEALGSVTAKIADWTNKKIKAGLDEKVDKVQGKSLSTNDYTKADKNKVDTMPDGLNLIDKKLYLTQNGKLISSSYADFSNFSVGGGGGGGSANVHAQSVSPETFAVALSEDDNEDVTVTFNFTSSAASGGKAFIKDQYGEIIDTISLVWGENQISVKKYLRKGTNMLTFTCLDSKGNQAEEQLVYTIIVVELTLTVTCDDEKAITQGTTKTISYKIIGGQGETKIHFVFNGTTTSETKKGYEINGTKTFNFAGLSHGVYPLKVYATTQASGRDVPSQIYNFRIMYAPGTEPLISSYCGIAEAKQHEEIPIMFAVYHSTNSSPEVTLTISQNGVIDSQRTAIANRDTRVKWPAIVSALTGNVDFTISYENKSVTHTIYILENKMQVEVRQDNLAFSLSAAGKLDTDHTWHSTVGDVSVTFDNVNWNVEEKEFKITDEAGKVIETEKYFIGTGWKRDEDGRTALRLSGDARATINFQPFKEDWTTNGKTIELEFAIRDVNNRDAIAIDCMKNGVGLKVTADTASIVENYNPMVKCNYVDNEKINISFVVEHQGDLRLVTSYLNGVLSSASSFTGGNHLLQGDPVNIIVGSPDCSIDLYSIRFYDAALTHEDIKNNYIADTMRSDVWADNDIYEYGAISYSKLNNKIPIMRITGLLPQSKDDTDEDEGGQPYYVDIAYTDRSPDVLIEASAQKEEAKIEVQGTSSQGYIRKNWKIKFDKEHQHAEGQMPTNVFCMKADYAEATGTHNTGHANFVHNFYTNKDLPPFCIDKDEPYRTTIYGFPCVIFHRQTSDEDYLFAGKYNFNYDKGSKNVFGFTVKDPDKYPKIQSWEFTENKYLACRFLQDPDGIVVDPDHPDDVSLHHKVNDEDWEKWFEDRYIYSGGNRDDLKRLYRWVYSTNQDLADGSTIPEYTGVDGTPYTTDTKAYRLAKFRKEFERHFNLEFCLVYYLYTFVMLMVDQRAKNQFLTSWDGEIWYPWLYDNDTSFGINNNGHLIFDYYHEDSENNYMLGESYVYNGNDSVLWVNFAEAFKPEIQKMYASWRTSGLLTYDKIIENFITNHSDKWSISIYNEDAEYKYLSMYRNNNDSQYLYQVKGTGEEHLKYFIKNRLMYCDSKWTTGDFTKKSNAIILRLNRPTNVNFPPSENLTYKTFSNMYAAVGFGSKDKISASKYTPRDKAVSFSMANESPKDLDTYIYGADEVSSLLDLSRNYCGSINVSAATKLTELIIGDATNGYENNTLTELILTNNRLLKKLNICNCKTLTNIIDLSLCPDIQEIYATGSGITGIHLPTAGFLKKITLPSTIATLSITNQKRLDEFVCEGYDRVTHLVIENSYFYKTKKFPLQEVLLGCNKSMLASVSIKNIDWDVESEAKLNSIIYKLLDNQENVMANCTFTGSVYLPEGVIVSDELKRLIHQKFPNLNVIDGDTVFYVDYLNYYNQIHETETVRPGERPKGPKTNPPDIVDPNGKFQYVFIGWDNLPTSVTQNRQVGAKWQTKYAVTFRNDDGTQIGNPIFYNAGEKPRDPIETGEMEEPTKSSGSTEYGYKFNGWAGMPEIITGPVEVSATFIEQYPVKFYSTSEGDSKQVQYGDTQWIIKGQDATKPAINPEKASTKQYEYRFSQWIGKYTDIQKATNIYAEYTSITRKYTVYFCNGSETLYPANNITYGNTATYVGDDPVKQLSESDILYGYTSADYQWTGKWSPEPTPNENTITTKGTGANKEEAVWCYPVFKFIKVNTESWDTIANNVATLADEELFQRYPIGTRKNLTFTIDGTDYNAVVEIIAHNHDDLTGGGKAKLTFFTNELPDLQRPLVITREQGWAGCALRAYMNDILFNALPGEDAADGNLQDAIKEVVKAYNILSPEEKIEYSNDKCWTVSDKEAATFTYDAQGNIQSSYPYAHTDGQGNVYSNAFSDNTSRKRHVFGGSSENTVAWWTRSLYDSSTSASTMAFYIGKIGAYYGHASPGSEYSNNYVAFGFCI